MDRRRQALELLGRGTSQVEVARVVGVSTKTLRRWRDAAAAEDPADRAERAALDATLPDGSPDHVTRLSAARLLGGPTKRKPVVADESAVVHVTITRDEDAGTVTTSLLDVAGPQPPSGLQSPFAGHGVS